MYCFQTTMQAFLRLPINFSSSTPQHSCVLLHWISKEFRHTHIFCFLVGGTSQLAAETAHSCSIVSRSVDALAGTQFFCIPAYIFLNFQAGLNPSLYFATGFCDLYRFAKQMFSALALRWLTPQANAYGRLCWHAEQIICLSFVFNRSAATKEVTSTLNSLNLISTILSPAAGSHMRLATCICQICRHFYCFHLLLNTWDMRQFLAPAQSTAVPAFVSEYILFSTPVTIPVPSLLRGDREHHSLKSTAPTYTAL